MLFSCLGVIVLEVIMIVCKNVGGKTVLIVDECWVANSLLWSTQVL